MPASKRKVDTSSTAAKAAKARVSQCPTPHSGQNGSLRISQKVETCAICFTDAQPMKAVRLNCRHGWYCEHCMRMHAEARLSMGDVCVPCPECREPIQDSGLKQFLTDDVVARFHDRSIQKAIASSTNLFTCPTANCDMCVELEPGEEPWLKKCPKCKKGSCLRCGAQPYHKGMTCQMHALRSRTDELRSTEMQLRKWMRKTGTKQCPVCNMGVTKEDIKNQNTQYSECHKMMCRQCGTRFCFKCLAVLTDTYTCGCSINEHGFVNPLTGRRVVHKLRVAKKKTSPKAANKASAAKAPAGRTARAKKSNPGKARAKSSAGR